MRPRITTGPDLAVTAAQVRELKDKFDYPDLFGRGGSASLGAGGGGGGMAHMLIVSDTEPDFVQAKADYVVPSVNSAAPLTAIFATVTGAWSIWMAGEFDLETDVTIPTGAWIRGLNYEGGAVV